MRKLAEQPSSTVIGSKKSLWRRIKDNREAYLLIAPSVIFLFTFSIYPLVWALRFAFFEYSGVGTAKFVGLDNFIRVFTRDDLYWKSVLNTFVYAGGKLILTIPISFLLAVLLNGKIRGKGFFRATVFMPTIISTAVMSFVFYYIFNTYNGILNTLLIRANLIDAPIEWLGKSFAMLSAIFVAAWSGIGNYMIYFLSGLQSIPTELYESASIDGASKWQQLRYITIPMMAPITQVVIMLAILAALKGYESIMVLTAGGPTGATEVMFLYVYRLFFPLTEGAKIDQQYGYGSAVALVSAVIVGVITLIYLKLSSKKEQ